MAVDAVERPAGRGTLSDDRQGPWQRLVLALFVAVPTLAIPAAVWAAWGWGLRWRDVVIGVVFYVVTGFGITGRLIRFWERLGWASEVRWPDPVRVAAKRLKQSVRAGSQA